MACRCTADVASDSQVSLSLFPLSCCGEFRQRRGFRLRIDLFFFFPDRDFSPGIEPVVDRRLGEKTKATSERFRVITGFPSLVYPMDARGQGGV